VVFLETPIFTQDVQEILSDEEYAELQQQLADRPESGDLIQGTGGLRKVRVGMEGRGKRGGARVIYYWRVSESQILMLGIYAKNETVDLSPAARKAYRKIVEKWK
jgi:hypothetical protein